MSWTLSSTQDTPDDIPDTIQDGVYTLVPTSGCKVASETHDQAQTIWFTTPVSILFHEVYHLATHVELGPR
jgi:hypothetical protein